MKMSLATWCTLWLSVLSLCQVSYALFGDSCNKTEYCNSTVLTFPNYYNCSYGRCGCQPGYTNQSGFCKQTSGQVSNVSLTDVTNTSATINWQKPSSPNGIISGYIIQVQLNNTCWHLYRINASSTSLTFCQNLTDISHFTDVKNVTETLHFTIVDLKPYRIYTVLIAAVNEGGEGIDFSIQFLTKVGTPYNVTNVHVDNSTTNQPTNVGLIVIWTPGEYTGPTTYSVCLIGGTTPNCIDTYKNYLEFPNLLGYWTYTITVQASTEAGVSEITEPVSATTEAKIPGLATFTLIQDQDIANKLYIDLKCPEVDSRNGIITKYIINILDINTSASENQTETPNLNCGNKMIDLKNIKAEHFYNISVQVQNHVYSGSFSPADTIFVEPRAEVDSTPAIVGGVVGGILCLVVIGAVVVIIIYFKRRSRSKRRPDSPYDSVNMSTVYNHPYNETQDTVYNEPNEEVTETPLDYGYIDVIN